MNYFFIAFLVPFQLIIVRFHYLKFLNVFNHFTFLAIEDDFPATSDDFDLISNSKNMLFVLFDVQFILCP
jgi:hypothetical protein